jgi:hypothetical protein
MREPASERAPSWCDAFPLVVQRFRGDDAHVIMVSDVFETPIVALDSPDDKSSGS